MPAKLSIFNKNYDICLWPALEAAFIDPHLKWGGSLQFIIRNNYHKYSPETECKH